MHTESTIVSEGFKGGTRGAPIMPRDAVSRTANVERNGGHKWDTKFGNSELLRIICFRLGTVETHSCG